MEPGDGASTVLDLLSLLELERRYGRSTDVELVKPPRDVCGYTIHSDDTVHAVASGGGGGGGFFSTSSLRERRKGEEPVRHGLPHNESGDISGSSGRLPDLQSETHWSSSAFFTSHFLRKLGQNMDHITTTQTTEIQNSYQGSSNTNSSISSSNAANNIVLFLFDVWQVPELSRSGSPEAAPTCSGSGQVNAESEVRGKDAQNSAAFIPGRIGTDLERERSRVEDALGLRTSHGDYRDRSYTMLKNKSMHAGGSGVAQACIVHDVPFHIHRAKEFDTPTGKSGRTKDATPLLTIVRIILSGTGTEKLYQLNEKQVAKQSGEEATSLGNTTSRASSGEDDEGEEEEEEEGKSAHGSKSTPSSTPSLDMLRCMRRARRLIQIVARLVGRESQLWFDFSGVVAQVPLPEEVKADASITDAMLICPPSDSTLLSPLHAVWWRAAYEARHYCPVNIIARDGDIRVRNASRVARLVASQTCATNTKTKHMRETHEEENNKEKEREKEEDNRDKEREREEENENENEKEEEGKEEVNKGGDTLDSLPQGEPDTQPDHDALEEQSSSASQASPQPHPKKQHHKKKHDKPTQSASPPSQSSISKRRSDGASSTRTSNKAEKRKSKKIKKSKKKRHRSPKLFELIGESEQVEMTSSHATTQEEEEEEEEEEDGTQLSSRKESDTDEFSVDIPIGATLFSHLRRTPNNSQSEGLSIPTVSSTEDACSATVRTCDRNEDIICGDAGGGRSEVYGSVVDEPERDEDAMLACLFVEVPIEKRNDFGSLAQNPLVRWMLLLWGGIGVHSNEGCDDDKKCGANEDIEASPTAAALPDIQSIPPHRRRIVFCITGCNTSARSAAADVLLSWTRTPCSEHAALPPLFVIESPQSSEADRETDQAELISFGIQYFRADVSNSVAVTFTPAFHASCDFFFFAYCGSIDSVYAQLVQRNHTALHLTRRTTHSDKRGNNSSTSLLLSSTWYINPAALVCVDEERDKVFHAMCASHPVALTLRTFPRRPEVALNVVDGKWMVGVVRPVMQEDRMLPRCDVHGMTLPHAVRSNRKDTNERSRYLSDGPADDIPINDWSQGAQKRKVTLERSQVLYVFHFLRDFFTPDVLNTSVNVLQQSGPDYLRSYFCQTIGYLRYRVSCVVRDHVRVRAIISLTAILQHMNRTQGKVDSAEVEWPPFEQVLCDWKCTCTPRPHERVLTTSDHRRKCRHFAQLVCYFLEHSVGVLSEAQEKGSSHISSGFDSEDRIQGSRKQSISTSTINNNNNNDQEELQPRATYDALLKTYTYASDVPSLMGDTENDVLASAGERKNTNNNNNRQVRKSPPQPPQPPQKQQQERNEQAERSSTRGKRERNRDTDDDDDNNSGTPLPTSRSTRQSSSSSMDNWTIAEWATFIGLYKEEEKKKS